MPNGKRKKKNKSPRKILAYYKYNTRSQRQNHEEQGDKMAESEPVNVPSQGEPDVVGQTPLKMLPITDYHSENAEINIVLNAMKDIATNMATESAKMDARFAERDRVDLVWKQDIVSQVSAVEQTAKNNTTVLTGFQTTVELMQQVANRTDKQSKTIDTTFDTIFAQLDIDRINVIRKQLKVEERLNQLEREHRSFNIRAQGVKLDAKKNLKDCVLDMFLPLASDLKKSHLEYVIKITSTEKEGSGDTADGANGATENALAVQGTGAKEPRLPILLIRFTDKSIRNKVFFAARKAKDKYKPKLVVRDDMIKDDHKAWTLAKPQMEDAHKAGHRTKCRYGRLTVESKQTPIDGLPSTDRRVHEINENAKIAYVRTPLNRIE